MTGTIRIAALTVLAAVLGIGVYLRVGNQQLDFLTGFLLLAAVVIAVLGTTEIGIALFGVPARLGVGLRLLVVTSGIMVGILELSLRIVGTYGSYLEKAEGRGLRAAYHTLESTRPTWFHVYSKNVEFTHRRAEFAFPRTTNSLGLCEREISTHKAPGEYRVIALGDSYTEGVGAPYEATWPKTLEDHLRDGNLQGPPEVFNAGVSGSDPWYAYMLLREKLLDKGPDLVLVAVNVSDVNDMLLRGGEERFQLDRTTRFTRPPPSWEWLYGISYLTRHIVHDVLQYNFLLVRESDLDEEQRRAVDRIMEAIQAFATLGREHNFDLLIVVHPDRWEAMQGRYTDQIRLLIEKLKQRTDLNIVDVLEHWKTTGVLERQNAESLYWEVDRHNNAEGYALLGKTIADRLEELNLLPSARLDQ